MNNHKKSFENVNSVKSFYSIFNLLQKKVSIINHSAKKKFRHCITEKLSKQ